MHWIVRRLSGDVLTDFSPRFWRKSPSRPVCVYVRVRMYTCSPLHRGWGIAPEPRGPVLWKVLSAQVSVPLAGSLWSAWSRLSPGGPSFSGSYPLPPWSRLKHLRPSALRVGPLFPPSHQRSLLWMSLPCGGHF